MSTNMVYVAADPEQPGAAWAIAAIDPSWSKETAKLVSGWIKKGALVQMVPREVGIEMLNKWVRPQKTPRSLPLDL